MSRRVELRRGVLNKLLGSSMRALDLILDHHLDQSRPLAVEAADVMRQTLLLLLETCFPGDDTVVVMVGDSSKLQLPKSLEESGVYEVQQFVRIGKGEEEDLGGHDRQAGREGPQPGGEEGPGVDRQDDLLGQEEPA